jgi:hypothetical protein
MDQDSHNRGDMELPEPTEFAWLADLQKCKSYSAHLSYEKLSHCF